MDKYRALTKWLETHEQAPFETSLQEIERVLRFDLPDSYRRHVAVWYGDRPSTAIGAIRDAGWRARSVDLGTGRLILEPSNAGKPPPAERPPLLSASEGLRVPDSGHWEGDVQSAAVGYLISRGWTVLAVADTGAKQRGDDIRARKGDRTLVVEVKGYPSRAYADPRRADETKVAHPSAQAAVYLAGALLYALRALGTRPDVEVAIAVPDVQRYRDLLAEVRVPLSDLGIGALLVGESVEEFLPLDRPAMES